MRNKGGSRGVSTGRGVAQTWPLGPGSPLECALSSRPPDCIPCVAASPASKCRQEGSGKLGEWRLSRQGTSFKTTAGRMQHAPTSRVFSQGAGESMSSLMSPDIQSDYREKGAELEMFRQVEEKDMLN